MAVSYLNDDFFSRLETLALNLNSDLSGFFGAKHLVRVNVGVVKEDAGVFSFSFSCIFEIADASGLILYLIYANK